jgi:hypothetical protein
VRAARRRRRVVVGCGHCARDDAARGRANARIVVASSRVTHCLVIQKARAWTRIQAQWAGAIRGLREEDMAEGFELIKVTDARQLHENLEQLLKNKKHIDSIIVDSIKEEIRVDLSKFANTFGKHDFKLKLQSGKSAEAKKLIERLKLQDAPARNQSEELYTMLAR